MAATLTGGVGQRWSEHERGSISQLYARRDGEAAPIPLDQNLDDAFDHDPQ